MNGLAGRIALVTGATGLLGGAIVHRLVVEGARVAIASRHIDKSKSWIEANGGDNAGQLIPVELDLADEASIRAAWEHLVREAALPTILIANASRREGLARPISELSHSDFSRLFEVDVAGHFLCARYLVEHTPPGVNASVVFLSSVYALLGVDHRIYPHGMAPTPPQYASAKSGMIGLTKYLAALWGDRQVRINAVLAGGVRAANRQPDEFVHNYASKTMLRRMAAPDEIASAVTFLASDESSYITGECLKVDGGLAAW